VVVDHLVMVREFVLPVLSDGRVLLRGWRQDDAPALRPACGDQKICRFTTVPHRYTIEDARGWIARQQAHACNGTGVVFAVVPLPDDRPVGMVGLFGINEPGMTGRFGYWLIAGARGQGLIGAATTLVADWGFRQLQLAAIVIDREPHNVASARVAERLGALITGSRLVQYEGAEVELVRHTLTSPNQPTRHQ
jgi:RimJ/RimL family protein N-acetyltransferase